MCGSLRREGQDKLVGQDPQPSWGGRGQKFRVVDQETDSEAMFNGHARKETLKESWLDKGWKRGDLRVSGYTERGREYDVPKGYVIDVVTRTIPGHGKIFNIITREAEGTEKEVHNRFPVLKRPRY